MNVLNKTLLITSLAILALTGCKNESKSSSAALSAPSGNACLLGKWSDSSLPLNLKMSHDFDLDYTAADEVGGLNPLEQMAKVWNDALGGAKTLITVPFSGPAASTGYATTAAFRDGEIGIYKAPNWFPNVSSDALAITQFYGVVTSSAGLGQYIQLTHADIIVNYRDYGPLITMPTNTGIKFDLRTIILHEMGHLLGLCHEEIKPSVMAPYYLTTQRSLKTYDTNIIKSLYIDGVISGLSKNQNALSAPTGTEVKGIIELKENGTCTHYVNGKKIFQHHVDLNKKMK